MMKVFNIKTTKQNFFYQYLLVVSEMIKIRPVAMRVFASILYWNDVYKDMDRDDRNAMIFSRTSRSKILQGLKMSRATLDNQFTYLRKKNLLLGNAINPKYEIFYDTHRELMFSFKADDND